MLWRDNDQRVTARERSEVAVRERGDAQSEWVAHEAVWCVVERPAGERHPSLSENEKPVGRKRTGRSFGGDDVAKYNELY